jgi:hypothetical protein
MANLSGGGKCARGTLILSNAVFLLIGFVLLGTGIWLVCDNEALQYLRAAIGILTTADLVWGAAIIILILSILIILVGLFGCCGALRHNAGCLGCYSGALIVLLIVQAIALILAGVFYAQIMSGLSTNMNSTLQMRYGKPMYSGSTKGWNILQVEVSCCGVKGPPDYQTSWWKSNQTLASQHVPDQCCVLKKKDFKNPEPVYPIQCQESAYDPKYPERYKYINEKGCETKADEWIKTYFGATIGVILGVLLFQIVIVVLACCLRSSIHSSYETL